MSGPPAEDVFLDVPWMRMHWDREHGCIYSEWKGFANSAEFRVVCMRGLQAVREKHATGYLSDTRKLRLIVHEDQKWANETVIPLMAAAGLKRMAMVTADSGLGKITVEEIIQMVDNKPLLMRSFDSVSVALKWVSAA